MGFKVDYSQAEQKRYVQDGDYEVIIRGASFNTIPTTGTEYISVKLTVRSDVAQPEQGEEIEFPLWKSRPENAKASDIEGVPAWRIQQISKAVQLPENLELPTIDDWFVAIRDRAMRVTTKQDDKGRAKVQRVEESIAPPPMKPGFVAVKVNDEELPF